MRRRKSIQEEKREILYCKKFAYCSINSVPAYIYINNIFSKQNTKEKMKLEKNMNLFEDGSGIIIFPHLP